VKVLWNPAPFSFLSRDRWAIFGAMIGCVAVVHAVRRFECVRPSATASALVRSSAS
jgi:hypothetical protein